MTLSFIWALVAICSWDLQPEKFRENWRITFGKLSYFKKQKDVKKGGKTGKSVQNGLFERTVYLCRIFGFWILMRHWSVGDFIVYLRYAFQGFPPQSTDRNQPKPAKKSIVAVFLGEIDGNLTLVNRERKSIPKIAKVIIRKALKYCWKLVLQHRYLPKVVELFFCQKRHLGLCWYCWWKKSCTSWYVVSYPTIYKVYT